MDTKGYVSHDKIPHFSSTSLKLLACEVMETTACNVPAESYFHKDFVLTQPRYLNRFSSYLKTDIHVQLSDTIYKLINEETLKNILHKISKMKL